MDRSKCEELRENKNRLFVIDDEDKYMLKIYLTNIDGEKVFHSMYNSMTIVNSGLNWGYRGGGPEALVYMLFNVMFFSTELINVSKAKRVFWEKYYLVMKELIAKLPQSKTLELSESYLLEVLETHNIVYKG